MVYLIPLWMAFGIHITHYTPYNIKMIPYGNQNDVQCA